MTNVCAGGGVCVGVGVEVLVGEPVGVGVEVFVGVPVGVCVGVGEAFAQLNTGDAELRGTGSTTTSKLSLLSFVSRHPKTFRTPPFVLSIAAPPFTEVPPSPFPAVPFPAAPQATQSTIYESWVASHGVAVAPQTFSSRSVVTSATLPLVADILRFPLTRSGVTGKAPPTVPAPPS